MTSTLLFDGEMSNDYHQIYLCDVAMPDLPDDYTDNAIARRVVAAPEAIIVHIEREMPVPVRVELHNQRPTIDVASFDHVVQTALSAPSGRLVLCGLLGDPATAPTFDVPAARLALLVTFEALGSPSDDRLEGQDCYAIPPLARPRRRIRGRRAKGVAAIRR